jgi:hypothetical protein
MGLAALLVEIALVWIFLHEESHYREGHFSYKQNMSSKGVHIDPKIKRLLELQADKSATSGVFQGYLTDEMADKLLPTFPEGLGGLFRIILNGIGLAIIMLDRGVSVNKQQNNYPSPITRLGMAARRGVLMVLRMMDVNHDIKDRNRVTFQEPLLREMYDRSFLWIADAFEDIYTIIGIINNEECSDKDTDTQVLFPNHIDAPAIAAFQLMWGKDSIYNYSENKEYREQELQRENSIFPQSQPEHEGNQEYLCLKKQMDGCWDELNELIQMDDDNFRRTLRKYRVPTMGSL